MTESVEGIYAVELLFREKPNLNKANVLDAIRTKCPNVEPLGEDMRDDLLAFVHPDHQVQYKDGSMPAQLLVFPGNREGDHLSIEPAIQQSWAFPSARDAVSESTHTVLVNDMMAQGLPYKERLKVFLNALEGILLAHECDAIHWRPSQQIVSRGQFLESRIDPRQHILRGGPLNARFFNVSNGSIEGECLADTMGLAVLGLPDVQCHFHSLDVDSVIHHLYNIALYLFDNGDVIESGHTVPGVADGQTWVCQHEDSLAPPKRTVLDLNPGPEFAAGRRT